VVVLDKLFTSPFARNRRLWHAASVHRRLLGDGSLDLHVSGLPAASLQDGDRMFALVDDATYTGGTLSGVLDKLTSAGIAIRRVLVAVAKERARQQIAVCHSVAVEAYYDQPVDGDVIHARDVYPWLPHSGRASEVVDASHAESPPGPASRRRIAPLLHEDGAWLTHPCLAASPVLRELAVSAVYRLRSHLRREPLVSDIGILGRHVAVPLPDPTDRVETEPLKDLVAHLSGP
jgi:hypothetical protein